MKISNMLLTPNIYSRPVKALKEVKKIAIHYIGNANTSALANRNYFNNLATTHKTFASCHYIIGLEGEIIRCIPENEIAYCTNSANSYSISIECCHPDNTGSFNMATYNALVELCADICKRYGLSPLYDIIRHYDVTQKCCPRWWSPNGPNKNANADFYSFKNNVKKFMEDKDMTKDEIINIVNNVLDTREKNYSSLKDIPVWAVKTVEKLINKGALKGSDEGLDLSYSLLRMLVINDRAGLYD